LCSPKIFAKVLINWSGVATVATVAGRLRSEIVARVVVNNVNFIVRSVGLFGTGKL
jgi:hypothetical protein